MKALLKFNVQQILLLQGDINYTNIHLTDGKVEVVAYTLKRLAFELKQYPEFVRIHKSHIINLSFIHQVILIQNRQEVILQNGIKLSVARRRRI